MQAQKSTMYIWYKVFQQLLISYHIPDSNTTCGTWLINNLQHDGQLVGVF